MVNMRGKIHVCRSRNKKNTILPNVLHNLAALCKPSRLSAIASFVFLCSSFAPSVPSRKPIVLDIPHEFVPFNRTDRTSNTVSQQQVKILLLNFLPG